MKPSFRKLLLTAHVTTSVATIGAVTGFLALAVVGLRGGEQKAAARAYQAMEVIAWTAILPLIISSLLTGLVQSLGSEWGLFRHYWIVVKLAINRSEEHTSELQSRRDLVCRLLLEKKKKKIIRAHHDIVSTSAKRATMELQT